MEQTRTCKICKIEKPITSFPQRKASKNNPKLYRRHHCHTCHHRKWKEANSNAKVKIRTNVNKAKQTYRDRMGEMKLQLMCDIGQTKCKNCGIDNPIVLCFHHRNKKEKSFGIAWGFGHSYAYETLLTEAKKCDVLCANCHLIHHSTPENRVSSRKQSPQSSACLPGPSTHKREDACNDR